MQYVLVFILWIVLLGGGYRFIRTHFPEASATTLLVGWTSAVTLILGAAFVAITTWKGWRASERLEREKSRLAEENARRAEDREDIRAAYNEVLNAMNQWYTALAVLETGRLGVKAIKEAESAMEKVRGSAERINNPCSDAFEDFFQRGNVIKELAENKQKTADEKRQIWGNQVKGFNESLETFKQRYKDSFAD